MQVQRIARQRPKAEVGLLWRDSLEARVVRVL